MISFPTSFLTIRRLIANAETSTVVRVSWFDSKLCNEEGGEPGAGWGVAFDPPKSEAKGFPMRATVPVGLMRALGRGGKGGFDGTGARGGRWSEDVWEGNWKEGYETGLIPGKSVGSGGSEDRVEARVTGLNNP